MLISHRHQFIFTKTIKSASTTAESYFEPFCMDEGEWQQTHGRSEYISQSGVIGFRGNEVPKGTKWWSHMPAKKIKSYLGQEKWDSYFKFTTIRNPYEKCISAFEHFGKNYQVGPLSKIARAMLPEMTHEQFRFYSYIKHSMPSDRDKYSCDKHFSLDDFIKFESLETDIKRICEKLSLPYEHSRIPQFKTGIRRQEATIKSLYTPIARELVKKKFKFELDYFGYDFPES